MAAAARTREGRWYLVVAAKDSLPGGLSFALSFCELERVGFAGCSSSCLVGRSGGWYCSGCLVFVLV